jgi:hypothetical protein
MKKREIPLVYLWIYRKFLDKGCNYLPTSEVIRIMRICIFHLKKTMCYDILKEMEDYGLVRKVNQHTYQILLENEKVAKEIRDFPFFIF